MKHAHILVNLSLRGTKQSLTEVHQTLTDCRAIARNDGDFILSKYYSDLRVNRQCRIK